MGKQGNPIEYRVLLCRYNEIGLKSAPYQKKLLTILVDSIKKICSREDLTLQSVLTLSGRLIFFFPSSEIPKAITVFRHVIGIQSISPALSAERKYEKLKQKFILYALSLLKDGDSFKINFKTSVSYAVKESDLKKEFSNEIVNRMNQSGYHVKVSQKYPKYQFGIEIREKGVYIYAFSIPTLFAGFPIETKNSLLCLWDDVAFDLIAAMMLVRRGSVVSPVIFHNKLSSNSYTIPPDSRDSLEILASFYSHPIPIHIFSLLAIKKKLNKMLKPNQNIEHYAEFASIKLLDIMMFQSREESIYSYNNRNLHYRGLISSNSLLDLNFFSNIKKNNILLFTPLSGLTPRFIQRISDQLFKPSEIFDLHSYIKEKKYDFSFNDEVIKSVIDFQSHDLEENDPINQNSNNNIPNYIEIQDFFNKSEIQNFLVKIIENHKIEYISGRFIHKNNK
ncbi:MAG: THUMP domain-containing protein [Promethearchaeota archaeon]